MTINIQTVKGDLFQYDPSNELIMKNGVVTSRNDYEPVFLNHVDKRIPPTLSGILDVKQNKIISRSGNISNIVTSNQIDIK